MRGKTAESSVQLLLATDGFECRNADKLHSCLYCRWLGLVTRTGVGLVLYTISCFTVTREGKKQTGPVTDGRLVVGGSSYNEREATRREWLLRWDKQRV